MKTKAVTIARVYTRAHTHTGSLINKKMNIDKRIAIKPINL